MAHLSQRLHISETLHNRTDVNQDKVEEERDKAISSFAKSGLIICSMARWHMVFAWKLDLGSTLISGSAVHFQEKS